jgi:hypothetical protein
MMIGMWTFTFMFIGIQYLVGDVFQYDIPISCTDADIGALKCSELVGKPIKSYLIGYINLAQITELLSNSLSGTDGSFDRIIGFALAAAYVAWNLVAILSGFTIFSLLWFLGVPFIIVTGIGVIYAVFLARAILGYVRGV